MDKNSIIGFILIAIILFGFTFYQGKKSKEYALAQQEMADSLQIESLKNQALAVASEGAGASASSAPAAPIETRSIYKDSLLERAHADSAQLITLENDKFVIVFTSRGAQPYSVKIKDYYNYDSTDLYLFRPGKSEYAITVYAGENIKTSDFNFDLAYADDTTVVFRLPFTGGGYIEQKYSISEGSYSVANALGFVGLQNNIPRNVSSIDIDCSMLIPRMEKGYKNETQYSKLNYYFEGDKKPVEIGKGRSGAKRVDTRLSWFAFQQQFFSTIVRAPKEFTSGAFALEFCPETDPERNLMTCGASMTAAFDPSEDTVIPFEFYYGPNSFQGLKAYDHKYEKIIPLGGWLVSWFTQYVIIPLFNFFNRFFSSFGLIILLMTIVIKTVVFPLTYKSLASSAKMSALKPEMDKLNAKYPHTDNQQEQMKKQQATMDLYKRAGVNPMGGCLPMLLTFPILWAMFRFFPASIELRQQSFLWCHDLSAYDSILDYGTKIPILGDHLSLFALLMAVVMWLYSKMTMKNQPNASDPSAKSMQFMTLWMMPIMMFFICNNVSAALSYYYLVSQLISIIQTWAIRRSIDPEKVLQKVHESQGKPLPKSKWQQRLEEAQKMQQKQLAEQQKKRR